MQTCGYTDGRGAPNISRGAAPAMLMSIQVTRVVDSLIAILSDTAPLPPALDRHTSTGAEVFQVWPLTKSHKQDSGLGTAVVELYTRPGKASTRGERYRQGRAQGAAGAAVVLGAGNQPFLSFTDTMCQLFVHQTPVVLKHHDAQVRCCLCNGNGSAGLQPCNDVELLFSLVQSIPRLARGPGAASKSGL